MKRRLDLWRVPSVLQLEDTECGAAALAMILAGFGRWVPLAEVRTACGISRDGSKAKNLVRAARSYGLEVAAARYNSAEPLRSLTMPAIVLVNLNHFLVLEGFERSGVSLNDPAEGRRRVTTVEFERMFSGIALTFAPGPGFKTGGCRPSTLALALEWLRGDRDVLALMTLIGLMQSLLGLLVPGFIRTFVDYGLYDRQDVLTAYMLPIMVAAALLQGTLIWWRGFLLVRLQTRVMLSACSRFVHRMVRLPILFFARRYPGSISNRTELAPDLAAHVAGIPGGLVFDGVTVVAFAALMVAWHPVLAAIALATGAATVLITAALHAGLGGYGRQLALLRGRLAAVTARSLSMLEDVKTSGTEDVVFSRWIGQLTLLGNREQEQGRLAGRLGALSDCLAMAAMVAVLIVGCALVMKGEITLGTLMGFQALHIGFCAAIAGLIERGRHLTGARSVFEQFADVLANPTAPEFAEPEAALSGPAGKPPMRLSGRVSVRGLSFGYVETEPALLDAFSLDLKPGSRVALVGESGSGKSTIGRLVNGLLLPWPARFASMAGRSPGCPVRCCAIPWPSSTRTSSSLMAASATT